MITEMFASRKTDLENQLASCSDVKDAADCLGRTLEQMRMETRAEAETPSMRRETDRLFDAAKQAALLLVCVTEADIAAAPDAMTKRDKIMATLPHWQMGVSVVLAAWMLLIGQTAAAMLAVAGVGLGAAQGLVGQRKLDTERLTARTRVNARELTRLTERLVQSLDDALSQAQEEKTIVGISQETSLPSELFAPMQMLMEAVYTQDGDYALKAVPQLQSALAEQGIEMVEFDPSRHDWFDLYPGTEEGLTIRPALVKEGRLLARGQATEKLI